MQIMKGVATDMSCWCRYYQTCEKALTENKLRKYLPNLNPFKPKPFSEDIRVFCSDRINITEVDIC